MPKNEVRNYEDNRRCDDLVESILDEAFEPTPKEPFQFRDDEERYEYRSDEHAHRSGDKSKGDYDNRDGLGGSEQNNDDDIDDRSEDSVMPGESMRVSKSAILSSTVWSSV